MVENSLSLCADRKLLHDRLYYDKVSRHVCNLWNSLFILRLQIIQLPAKHMFHSPSDDLEETNLVTCSGVNSMLCEKSVLLQKYGGYEY